MLFGRIFNSYRATESVALLFPKFSKHATYVRNISGTVLLTLHQSQAAITFASSARVRYAISAKIKQIATLEEFYAPAGRFPRNVIHQILFYAIG